MGLLISAADVGDVSSPFILSVRIALALDAELAFESWLEPIWARG